MTTCPPLVAVENVWFSYSEQEPALRGVSLSLHTGELVALAGANGSGKTTLAKQLNGLLQPARGRVLIEGRDTRQLSLGRLAQTVGYVFQNPDHQIFLPSVAQEVAYGPRNLGLEGEELTRRVEEALERFGLSALRDRHPTLLGRGLRRQVALAGVYAMRPRLLLLDEPTGGLDRRATLELIALLEELVAQGRTVVLISHDMRLIAEHVPRLVVLRAGKVVADGPTREVMADETGLRSAGIRPPEVARLASALAPFAIPFALRVDELCQPLVARLGARAHTRPPAETER